MTKIVNGEHELILTSHTGVMKIKGGRHNVIFPDCKIQILRKIRRDGYCRFYFDRTVNDEELIMEVFNTLVFLYQKS